MEKYVSLKNVSKIYRMGEVEIRAVDGINFEIEKGEFVVIVGPSGAGKSTTMNIMTGYLGATEGKVLIQGHDILKEPELAKKFNVRSIPMLIVMKDGEQAAVTIGAQPESEILKFVKNA